MINGGMAFIQPTRVHLAKAGVGRVMECSRTGRPESSRPS